MNTGIDINIGDLLNETPMFYAAKQGRIPVLKFYKNNNYNLNQLNSNGENLIHCAIQSGFSQIIPKLHGLGVTNFSAPSLRNGETPVYLLAKEGELEVLQYMVHQLKIPLTSIITDEESLMRLIEIEEDDEVIERIQQKITEQKKEGYASDQITISIREIAEIMGHKHIIDFIDKQTKKLEKISTNPNSFFEELRSLAQEKRSITHNKISL